MNYILSDHIITPVATGTSANLQAVIEGRTALRTHTHRFSPVAPFYASLMENGVADDSGLSRFESLCIAAIRGALRSEMQALLTSSDTIFILSTTKGNVEHLAMGKDPLLHSSAKKISTWFGNPNSPIVVCNACISGVCGIITAQRLLDSRLYRNAVVVGCDVLSTFIISGFQSFKALSDERCRPFDISRNGLNLGEAAACMILSSDTRWAEVSLGTILASSIHNDANHISGPSRVGEGSYLCLRDVVGEEKDKIAFINLHGTATLYNDEMESIAVMRAGLQDVPVNSLKSIFGHTLGAAGLLETILSLHALRAGMVLPVHNYSNQGTTYPLNISTACRKTDRQEFIKLLSGFGGCNAAIRVSITPAVQPTTPTLPRQTRAIAEVYINPEVAMINGQILRTVSTGESLLTELYRTYVKDYPKYFKMDTLARLGFIASELLLSSLGEEHSHGCSNRAIVFANHSASIKNDTDYQHTIQDIDNYYPSPSLFVYTLPNIVTGEVSIRNKYYGETSFYVLDAEDQMSALVKMAFLQPGVDSVVGGWVECSMKDRFEAHLSLVKQN